MRHWFGRDHDIALGGGEPARTPRAPSEADLRLVTPIGALRWRDVVTIRGTVASIRVVPWVDASPVLECTVFDDTGGITLVFLGRQALGGLILGRVLEAEGRVIEARRRLVLMNPIVTMLPSSSLVTSA